MSKRSRPVRPPRASAAPSAPAPSFPWGKALALASGVIPALLALVRFPFINGAPYWPWRYYDGRPALFAAAALVVWAALYWADQQVENEKPIFAPLALLVVLHVGLIVGFTSLSEQGLGIVGERVRHPDITSYHTEAVRIDALGPWLADYPQRLGGMIGHAQTHPPGPILYYGLWNSLLGPEAGAQWGGVFLALLGGLAIPLLYSLVRRVSGFPLAGFAAAAAWTPLPGVVHMLGSFDAVYPVFTLGLCLLWIGACWDGRRAWAAGFGALLTLALLFTHSFLTLGACFLLLALAPLAFGAERGPALRRFVEASAVGGGVCLVLFALLWAVTGYDHLAALRASMRIQEGLAGAWNRPWRLTVIWDVYDFFLASGWACFGIVTLFLVRQLRGSGGDWRLRAFTVAAVGTLFIVDVSGLLRAETARVWLFLQPLSLALVGFELARWSPGWRSAAYAVLLFALVAIRSRMIFL
ncbi:MAG: hypothetical protein GC160_13345 [Acidobacteria bacterium]|nr:hypothetical protein [Acidobacteriota bacterium]